jgi:hypothetical protein
VALATTVLWSTGSRSLRLGRSDGQLTRYRSPILKMVETSSAPKDPSHSLRGVIVRAASVVPLGVAFVGARSSGAVSGANIESIANAFTDLGDMRMCRLLNGMWQVSGAHGYLPERDRAVAEMSHCAGMSVIFTMPPCYCSL